MHCPYLAPDILSGDVALVTGGGSGINQGIARMFAAHGARVVVIGRRQDKLEQTCALIREAGGKAEGYSADVRDFDAMREAAASGARHFGPYSIVVAGAAGNFLSPAAQLSGNGFGAVVDIDLKGTFHAFRTCLARILHQTTPVIEGKSDDRGFSEVSRHSFYGDIYVCHALRLVWPPSGARAPSAVVPATVSVASTPDDDHPRRELHGIWCNIRARAFRR